MDEYISLKTHIPLWHASPRCVMPDLQRAGISLMREYIWFGAYPYGLVYPCRAAQRLLNRADGDKPK